MPSLRHYTFGLAAIAWGAVPVWFYAANRIKHYLDPDFHTIALCGGLGMIVLGLFNILTAGESADCGHDHDDDHDHEHSDQNPLVTLLLMILPVIGALYWTQDSYSDAALRRKTRVSDKTTAEAYFANLPPFTRETLEKNTSQTDDGHFQLELTQLFWSAGDEEFMKVFDGLQVEVEGQLMPEDAKLNPDGKRARIFRVFMTCCAADAQVIGFTAAFPDAPPAIPDRSWVKLKGTVAYEKIDGRIHIVLHATAHEPMPAPQSGYRTGLPF